MGSSLRRHRKVTVAVLLLALLLLATLLSFLLGTRPIAPATFWNYLTGTDVSGMDRAVIDQRAVRTLWAVTVGASLAIAGAGMQGVTRNPLGDPGILGLNAGAAFAVVVGIVFFGLSSPVGFAALAFMGATVTAVVVYVVAAIGRDGATPVKLALMGAAVSAGLLSLTSAFLLRYNDALDSLRKWRQGTIAGANMEDYFPGIFLLVAGALILLLGAQSINNFALGDDMAASLGENVALKRLVMFVGIALLAGTATSMAGPIAFLGLMVPHALRALVGPDYRLLVPFSGILGATVLTLSDTVGRIVLPPEEVPVGVTMVVLGVPVFIFLIRSRKTGDL